MSAAPDTIIDVIADIFRRRGADSYLGEAVTMSEHMLQAADLARREDAPAALVAAALLHDIGHYSGDFPDDALLRGVNNHHDEAAARILGAYFPAAVVEPIRLHVDAKRYLCAVEPDYFGRLSQASVDTLRLQGGPMTAAEAAAFRAGPYCAEAVRVRRWDEAGKTPGRPVPPFDHYVPLLRSLLLPL